MQLDAYYDERERRIQQFTRKLKYMYHRAHIQDHGSSCIIFSEALLDENDSPCLDGAVTIPIETQLALAAESDESRHDSFLNSTFETSDSPSPEEREARIVQYCFERRWFCSDLPKSTIESQEVARLMRDRSGFFYVKDNAKYVLNSEDHEIWNPVRKAYLYGDERCAAEDTAYIFFDLWRFPVDSLFNVQMFAFGDEPRFRKARLI
jgi:hypothetical protein